MPAIDMPCFNCGNFAASVTSHCGHSPCHHLNRPGYLRSLFLSQPKCCGWAQSANQISACKTFASCFLTTVRLPQVFSLKSKHLNTNKREKGNKYCSIILVFVSFFPSDLTSCFLWFWVEPVGAEGLSCVDSDAWSQEKNRRKKESEKRLKNLILKTSTVCVFM